MKKINILILLILCAPLTHIMSTTNVPLTQDSFTCAPCLQQSGSKLFKGWPSKHACSSEHSDACSSEHSGPHDVKKNYEKEIAFFCIFCFLCFLCFIFL